MKKPPRAGTTPRPRLSLCMIVRDEEEALDRCLAAAAPFVDEIVVVDTGSRDRSREIARLRGARVLETPWTDDFSAARNVSLDAATGDWIVVLDADETISPETGRALRDAAGRPDVFGCFLPLVNVYDDRGLSLTALILRAWRNRPEIRFKNRIHEQVMHAVTPAARAAGARLVSLPGAVRHDGYRPSIVASRGKNERNLRLFELAAAEAPDDLYLRFKFAEFLRRFPDRAADRLRLLDQGVADVRKLGRDAAADLPFAAEFFALRAEEHRLMREPDAAAALAEEGGRAAEATPNLVFAEASARLDLGQAVPAEALFRRCLAQDGQALMIPGRPGVTGVRARRGLADALRLQGRHAEARVELERVLDDGGRAAEAPVWDAWLDATLRAQAAKPALGFLTARLAKSADDAPAWTAGGKLLEACGIVADAAKWRLRAAELRRTATLPPEQALRDADLAAAAEMLLRQGDLQGAFDTAASARGDARADAVLTAVCAAAAEPTPEFVDAAAPAVRAAFRKLLGALANCRAEGPAVLERLTAARRSAATFDPTAAALLAEAAV